MAKEVDVAIVGAGAAGIAAGRRLAETRSSFLLLEAADRVGGRARTESWAGLKLDLGCGWLHSADRNPWAQRAAAEEVAIDRTPPPWGSQFADLNFAPAEQRAANEAFEAFGRRLRESPPASDRASDALDPACPWNGYIEALCGYLNGVGLARLSVRDHLAYDEADSAVNWRLPAGYGALIVDAAEDLPVALGAEVIRIDRRGGRLLVETRGGMISARCAIVAVPTPVIARLGFDPALDDKLEAAASLPLGLAEKLFLALDEPEEFAADSHLLGKPGSAETGSYHLRPFARPLIEAFYGGAGAEMLQLEGERALAAFALEELGGLLGSSFRRRCRPIAASGWGRSPLAGGAYSHALPGMAGARQALAAAVEDRLFFAGEACSHVDFATAHGAFESGVHAAEQAIAALTPAR